MNVAIVERTTKDVIARYEIHKAGNGSPPPDDAYFDEAWQRAVEDARHTATQHATERRR